MKKLFIVVVLLISTQLISITKAVRRVAVFCSADDKACKNFKDSAFNLGRLLGQHGFGLVTGGSRTGLMKKVIDGYRETSPNLENIYGVLPNTLKKYNVHHQSIPEKQLLWVSNMHTRLSTFHELSDIVIVLPGGYGTLHELMDFLVHYQFGLSNTKIILFNPDGYWNSLLKQFNVMHEQNLLSSNHLRILLLASTQEICMKLLLNASENGTLEGLNTLYWQKN